MEYRTLPHGGEKLSVIGLGLGIVKPEDYPQALLEYALEQGINFFDLCIAFEDVWQAVRPTLALHRAQVFTQMHLGAAYKHGAYAFTRNLNTIQKTFLEKLALSGLDYTDFLMLHCIDEEADLKLVLDKGIYAFAQDCLRQGLARHLGFSTHNPTIAQKLLDIGGFDLFMFSINAAFDFKADGELALGDHAARAALYQQAAAQGVGISVMKPFAGGQLLDARLSPLGVALSVPQCLHYCLDRPAVLSCLTGACRKEEIDASLRYLTYPQERDYAAAMAPANLVQNLKRCVYCNHCAPCPKQLNVALINKYYDLSRLGDELARAHYRQLSHHAGECNDCGHCDKRCPFHTPQMARMHEIAAYFGF
ncbi:MAG: aldo/keto reductase [Candidatus Anaerobiospirillum merdipullorum]|uniref:Aldo/keto reductase n=1 Tax=Candidatus Anaerobiospirillum merdipullorum TaxID=2838450 RepID=A0A9E2NU07_9GAMM|nr:aldo/keto reductase [Candidatus Anaerobiospirillum merdipullorum]